MKIFNVVLAVLIFLLAVASAVFSFFLFEKRAQLVDSYSTLTKQYAKSAKDLDGKTGKNVAKNITTDQLSHSNVENLDAKMKEFDLLVADVIKERDAMAEALVTIAEKLELQGFTVEDFQNITTYEAKLAEFNNRVATYKSSHDQLLQKVQNTYSKLASMPAVRHKVPGRISAADLRGANMSNKYAPIDNAIAELDNRNKGFENVARSLSRKVGSGNLALTGTSYAQDFRKLENGVTSIINARNKAQSDLRAEINKVNQLNREVASLKRTIAQHTKTIAAHKQEIKDLRQTMMVPEQRAPKKDKSREALDMIRTQGKGKVLSVDDKYGIVIISLGKKTRVVEQFGKQTNVLDPQIPEGSELIVVRNMPSGKAEHINSLKIVKLDDHCSVAEPLNKDGSKPVMAGDVVYFTDSEIEAIIKNRK